MEENKLTSLQNPKVKELVKLRDRTARDKNHQFLIEGYRELLRAVDSNYPIQQLFICESFFLGTNEGTLIDRLRKNKVPIFSCSESVFKKISYRDRPDGLLAIAPQQHCSLSLIEDSLNKKEKGLPFLLIAESIEKPGNLGTILRSADAVGVDGLIVCDPCTDIYNPNVVRASVGTLFTVPIAEASTHETITWLREKKIAILAATPHASQEFTQINMNQPIAVVVGTEQLGLSKEWINGADLKVRIPMFGVADSLNVATATTLLLYEVLRQRRLC